MKDRNRLKLFRARKPRPAAVSEGKVLRGFALLMSDVGQHGLAAELMRQAKTAIRKAA